MKTNKYIHQTKGKGYACCVAIAFLNALIYYDKPFIESLDDPKWESLVDRYCCRNGSVLGRDRLAAELGLIQVPIEREDICKNFPVYISSYTDVGFHASLVIDTTSDLLTIVNYNGFKGAIVEEVLFSEIKFPPKGVPVDRQFHLKLI